ncbi:MAG: trypsin-like peptidase domain-containing protein [Chloroflexi bacterium]|nr:trypsin-like peptidase domain-containing protein [Chloroflexota bacterium]
MRRGTNRWVLVALGLALVLILGARVARAQTTEVDVEVRVAAQRLADGRTEFALQERAADGSWDDRRLPNSRFFPANTRVGRWLGSSPLTVEAQADGMQTASGGTGVTVRVAAQLLADGRMEFALQEREPDGSWGDRRLPARRFFPANPDIGRWLSSSPLTVRVPAPAAAPPASPAECSAESTATRVTNSIAAVSTGQSIGTAFYIGNSEWVTAEHVVTGETSVRLVNAAFDVTAQVVGTRADVDLAVLSASTDSTSPLQWGELPGTGAQALVLGYGSGQQSLVAGMTQGIVSERYMADGQTYIRTDAPANPGNSGGPLLDLCGNVTGVVQSKLVGEAIEGVAYALAADSVQELLPSVRTASPSGASAPPAAATPRTLTVSAFCTGDFDTAAACRASAVSGLDSNATWEIWVSGVENWGNVYYSIDGAEAVAEDDLTLSGLAPGRHTLQIIEQQTAGWTEWSAPYMFTIRAQSAPPTDRDSIVRFLRDAYDDVFGFASEISGVDRTYPSVAATVFQGIKDRAWTYFNALWDDYDLRGFGISCDLARQSIANAAGDFSNTAGWYALIYRYWPNADYFDEVGAASDSGFENLGEALTEIADCATGS